MKRRLFNILSALSLMLCAIISSGWLWSCVSGEVLWSRYDTEPEEVLRSVSIQQPTTWRAYLELGYYEPVGGALYVQEYSLAGVHYESQTVDPPWFGDHVPDPGAAEGIPLKWDLQIPLGYLIPLSVILPAFRLRPILRRRGRRWRRLRGLCVACGYDLRASSTVAPSVEHRSRDR